MIWKTTGSMIIFSTLFIVFLHCQNIVCECPPGQQEVKLTPGNKVFGLHVAMNKYHSNPYNAVMGTRRRVKLANGDLFIIDTNGKTFSLKELCLTVKGAEQVDIIYFGYGLLGQVGRDSQKIVGKRKKRICCENLPTHQRLRSLWMKFMNSKGFNGTVKAKEMSLTACMTIEPHDKQHDVLYDGQNSDDSGE